MTDETGKLNERQRMIGSNEIWRLIYIFYVLPKKAAFMSAESLFLSGEFTFAPFSMSICTIFSNPIDDWTNIR